MINLGILKNMSAEEMSILLPLIFAQLMDLKRDLLNVAEGIKTLEEMVKDVVDDDGHVDQKFTLGK